MKKIVNSKIFLVIITMIICISGTLYATNTYNSSSILYTTSDGKNMSVSDALNDLYENGSSFAIQEGATYSFSYTGDEQTLILPATGIYKLEIWGAQGGSYGYGGYSTGTIDLNRGDILYINVGGKGASFSSTTGGQGGYNGGGQGGNGTCGWNGGTGGGGATHIAIKSGLLSTLSQSIETILIVAGGGGGSTSQGEYNKAGSGGGITGVKGSYCSSASSYVGTQTTGYVFGQGSDGRNATCGSYGSEGNGGGGGGFYGGGASTVTGSFSDASAGGGSGYIGNSLLTNKSMYCYNCTTSEEISTKTISTTCTSSDPTEKCSKQGNGYAKITYLGT